MKTSYSVQLFNLNRTRIHAKTFEQLKRIVMKELKDKRCDFEVYVHFEKDRCEKFYFDTKFEIWCYERETDKVYNYNLRQNRFYKALRRYERKLRPIMMKSHVVNKK